MVSLMEAVIFLLFGVIVLALLIAAGFMLTEQPRRKEVLANSGQTPRQNQIAIQRGAASLGSTNPTLAQPVSSIPPRPKSRWDEIVDAYLQQYPEISPIAVSHITEAKKTVNRSYEAFRNWRPSDYYQLEKDERKRWDKHGDFLLEEFGKQTDTLERDLQVFSRLWTATRGVSIKPTTNIHRVRHIEWDMSAFSKNTIMRADIQREIPAQTTIREPFDIPETTKFEHQFVLAPPGSGKTTLIEAQLAEDFEKVARGQCSVIVIDGEDVLVRDLAYSKIFAPGGKLYGKLIYLEPESSHPLSLNVFDIGDLPKDSDERTIALQEAIGSITSCLSDMNAQQHDLLSFLVEFCLVVPNSTILDLVEMLKPDGLKAYEKWFPKLNPTVQTYFQTVFKSQEARATQQAVYRRLFTMLRSGPLRDIFSSKRNRFRIEDEVSGGKVILINAKRRLLGEHGCQLFGQFFLSQLMQFALTRDETSFPIFCYVDECQDIIGKDDKIGGFLFKARKRRIGMIFATQDISEIKSDRVRSGLENVAITFKADRATQKKEGLFQAFIARKTPEPIEVQVQRAPDLGRMSEAEFAALKDDMRTKYCTTAVVEAGATLRKLLRDFGADVIEYWPDFEAQLKRLGGFGTNEERIDRLAMSPEDTDRLHELRKQRNIGQHGKILPEDAEAWARDIQSYTKILSGINNPDPAAASPER